MTCLLTLGSTTGYSSPKNYKLLKDKIDEYENSVIKDFSFAVPENYQQNLKEQMKLGILLEEKFTEQKKLFYNAEEGLFKLEDSLEQRIKDGKLTQTEADNLITSVEYARRIILYTRKTEVHSQYSKIREQLIVTPDLENLYKKFQESELTKYKSIYKKLEEMLVGEDQYNEKQWQNEMLQIILLLYPKYINVFENTPVKDDYNRKVRKLDYL